MSELIFFVVFLMLYISLRLWKTLLPNWEVFVDFEYMTSGCYLNSMVLKDSTKLQSWHNIYSLHSNLYTTCYFPVWLFFKSLCVSLGMVIVTQGRSFTFSDTFTLCLCGPFSWYLCLWHCYSLSMSKTAFFKSKN